MDAWVHVSTNECRGVLAREKGKRGEKEKEKEQQTETETEVQRQRHTHARTHAYTEREREREREREIKRHRDIQTHTDTQRQVCVANKRGGKQGRAEIDGAIGLNANCRTGHPSHPVGDVKCKAQQTQTQRPLPRTISRRRCKICGVTSDRCCYFRRYGCVLN